MQTLIFDNIIFFHTDTPTKAGGAALYIAKNIKAIPRPDIKFKMQLVESCWCEIAAGKNKKTIIIGCIYRHPTCDLEEFRAQLNDIIKTLNLNKYEIYILGDLNIDFLKYNSHLPTEDYLDMLFDNNLLPIITKPTRLTEHTATLIDHIYTNSPLPYMTSGILTVDISDHLPVFCVMKSQIERTDTKEYNKDYSKFKKELFLNDINSINWEEIFKPDKNLHKKTQNMIDSLSNIVNKHVPMKRVTQAKQIQLNKPWITKGILKSIKRKRRMYRTHYLSKDAKKINAYKKYANMITVLKQKSKKDFYSTQFLKYKYNLKHTWKLIGTLIKRKTKGQSYPTRIIHNNKVYTKRTDIAELFNNYFVNIGPTLAKDINDSNVNCTQYTSCSPSNSFLYLSENKACIEIPNKLIKLASGPLSIPLTKLYNESISTGIVPDVFKISRVTPIFKSGSVIDLGNYRPIAVISPFSKVLERMVYDQLIFFLERQNILFNYQFGFRKGYSTEYAILETMETLKTAIDENKITCGIFLDFSKAFDTINHHILLEKMNKYGSEDCPIHGSLVISMIESNTSKLAIQNLV